ncbi:Hypothetical protein RY69_157 [Bifidobacterium breve]|nr:Hypothetical protein RY69_157 [Bifidobacterium breve]
MLAEYDFMDNASPENRGIVSAPANVGLDAETASLHAERHQ